MKNSQPNFRRSLIIVACIHCALILGILYFMRKPVKPAGGSVTWLETGSFATSSPAASSQETPAAPEEEAEEEGPSAAIQEKEPIVEPVPPVVEENIIEEESMPEEISTPPPAEAASEIPLATPTPKPTPQATPKPTPKPKPKPKAMPKQESTPIPKPKVTPKKEPSPKPHSSLKKATIKKSTTGSPKKKSVSSSGQKHATQGEQGSNQNSKKAFLASKKGGDGGASGALGAGNGGANAANNGVLDGYHELIHDRFYSQWEQPTSIPSEHKHDFSSTLQLTIERDGTISHFTLAKPSGNPVMDASVLAAAAKVIKIAPLPQGVGGGGAYIVNINFELE